MMSETKSKLEKLRTLMWDQDIEALRLKGVDWFSWLTGGGRSNVLLATETGVAEIFLTTDLALILTNKIEQSRLAEEEIPPDLEILAFPWAESSALENFVYEHFSPELCYSDRPREKEKKLPHSFEMLKIILEPDEINRYRKLSRLAAEAMTDALLKAEPRWTENQLAGEGAKALWSRGIDPALIMVGSHRRSESYRHPIAGNNKLGDSAMMVFCARAFGLYANLTRYIYFRPPTDAEMEKFKLVAEVEDEAFRASIPGKPLREIYDKLAETYRRIGHPEEIDRHHQGGITGYLSREYVASKESPPEITLARGMALAWNPSFPGAKMEDTILIGENGIEILTVDSDWPTWNFADRERPDILVKI